MKYSEANKLCRKFYDNTRFYDNNNVVGYENRNNKPYTVLNDDSDVGILWINNKPYIFLNEFAMAPASKRPNQPKFRLRFLPGKEHCDTYLNQNIINKYLFIDDGENNEDKQTVFTESEYNRIRKYYLDWLPKFDQNDQHFEFIGEEKL